MPGAKRHRGAETPSALIADPAVAQIPAIMLTGHGSEESEVRCLQAGADDFVTKPINAAVLRARIETQLRLRSMRRQLQRQNDELEEWRRNLERDLAAARLTQQSLIPQKPPTTAGMGSRHLLSACHPSRRRYLRLAAHERWPDVVLDCRWHRPRRRCRAAYHPGETSFHHGSVEHDDPATVMEAVNNDFRSIFGARSLYDRYVRRGRSGDRTRERRGCRSSSAPDRATTAAAPNRSHRSRLRWV